jgi:asparagine synthase (glutamine-hydrolysing)
VPVLLSGIGADELFWGYEWVRLAVQRTIDKKRRRAPRWLAKLIQRDPDRAFFYDSLDWMRDTVPAAGRVMTPEATAQVPPGAWTSYFESDDWSDVPLWLTDVQNKTWLVSNCLALCDRVSMAHSVELRLPFLDFALADAVTGIRRAGLQDWAKPHKWLLIEATGDLLPREVFERKKRGFTPPVAQWMDAVVSNYRRYLNKGALVRRGVFIENADQTLPHPHPVGFAYRVVLLEMWARLFLDRASVGALRTERQAVMN